MATITAEANIQLGGSYEVVFGSAAFDSSYPTGGEALDLAANARIEFAFFSPTAGYSIAWDRGNQKAIVYYADYDAVADGALIQVPNTTNLATVLADVPFFAIVEN